jgi:hypothetical protein
MLMSTRRILTSKRLMCVCSRGMTSPLSSTSSTRSSDGAHTSPHTWLWSLPEDADEGNVFEHIKHQDKITVSISPAMYTMKFIASEPSGNGGIQYFVHPKNAAVGSVSMSSPEKLRESWFQNVSWMKDSSQEDVEAHKIAHKKEMDDDRTGEKETEVGDVDMAEA